MAPAIPPYLVPYAFSSAGFLIVSLAYVIAAQQNGFRFPENATGMPPIWAGIFACTGLIVGAILLFQRDALASSHPRYTKALIGAQALWLIMVFIGFISLAALKDAHGAVWSGFAVFCFAIPLTLRLVQSNKSTGSPVLPLRDAPGDDPADTATVTAPSSSCSQKTASLCLTCSLWTTLILMTIFIVSFGAGTAMTAREQVIFSPPGITYTLAASPGSDKTVKVHLYCTGTRASPTRPIVLFEHGGGSCGFAFYGAQQTLAAAGIRSCAYDRPGFGWSEAVPVGTDGVEDYNHIITSLLAASGEAGPYIAAGHSVGGEYVQVFAFKNPADVVALSLLDGYPDYQYLMGWSKAEIQADNVRVCSALQAARAFEGTGLVRAIQLGGSSFHPESEKARFTSTYTNGHNFGAQWRVYCRSKTPDQTSYLNEKATTTTNGHNPDHPEIKWPQFAGAVQIISASDTVLSKMYGYDANVYYTQAKAYNQTLSSSGQSEWLICDPCFHDFPYAKAWYLGDQLVNLYNRV